MTTRTSRFPLRLPVSMKEALEKTIERDGTSMNWSLVIAAAEKIAAMETERFFEERRRCADRKAFRRILNRKGGEPQSPDDAIDGHRRRCGSSFMSSMVIRTARRPSGGSKRSRSNLILRCSSHRTDTGWSTAVLANGECKIGERMISNI
jgi:hypothetical protein